MSTTPRPNHKNFYRFSLLVLITVLFVILWGAYVRASGSGAGCGRHWPLCNGEILPDTSYSKTFVEFTHRLTSGLSFLMVVAMYCWSRKLFSKGSRTRKAAFLSLIFIAIEALVGAGLVLLQLVENDASITRAWVIGGHLVNSLLLVGFLALCSIFSSHPELENAPPRQKLKPLLLVSLLGTLLVSAAGAVTALGDTLFPSESLAAGIAADLSPHAHFLLRLRVWHPILAIVLAFIIVSLAWSEIADKTNKKAGYLLVLAIVGQIILGFVNLLLLAPVSLQILHLLGANLSWMALVYLSARIAYSKSDANTLA